MFWFLFFFLFFFYRTVDRKEPAIFFDRSTRLLQNLTFTVFVMKLVVGECWNYVVKTRQVGCLIGFKSWRCWRRCPGSQGTAVVPNHCHYFLTGIWFDFYLLLNSRLEEPCESVQDVEWRQNGTTKITSRAVERSARWWSNRWRRPSRSSWRIVGNHSAQGLSRSSSVGQLQNNI